MAKSKDLFDDSTMSFGEHLEVLRIHLWKAVIGLVLCIIAALFFGNYVIALVRSPIDTALKKYGLEENVTEQEIGERSFLEYLRELFGDKVPDDQADEGTQHDPSIVETTNDSPEATADKTKITLTIQQADLARVLHDLDPAAYPRPSQDAGKTLKLVVAAPEFAQLQAALEKSVQPVTLTVQEAFMMYLKVALVSGFVMASPWVFYQLWLFVAAGLYPHERKYVHIYLPISITLFLTGAAFCFWMVFPFVLNFLLSFNKMMHIYPQIRLSEWISFAIMLPLMFGLSFQLPLVMLFLERISIFETSSYREKRRMAILVISVISMFLTPADPMSMIMMMIPLVCLYELGILMCHFPAAKSPFEAETA